MGTFNRVVLAGRLCQDVELRYTASQKAVCNGTLATDEGTRAEPKPQFHKIVVWGKSAEYLSKYAGKGDLILVEGKIENREWIDPSNCKRFATEVVCNNATLLNTKKKKSLSEGGTEEMSVTEAVNVTIPAVDTELDNIPF